MNAFILDTDPTRAAQMHCDKHVVKMGTEAAQVLWTVSFLETGRVGMMKPTHMGHPLVSWSRASSTNFEWLRSLGIAICHEYEFRYGRTHDSLKKLELVELPNGLEPSDIRFVQCMPEEHRSNDPVASYRKLYLTDKARMLKYTRRQPPDWIPDGMAVFREDSKIRLRRLMCQ